MQHAPSILPGVPGEVSRGPSADDAQEGNKNTFAGLSPSVQLKLCDIGFHAGEEVAAGMPGDNIILEGA